MLLPFGCFTFASCEEVNETCNTLSTPTNTHENTRQLARGVLLSGEGQVCGMRPVITAPHVDCWFSPPSSPWTRSFFTHTSIQLYISTSVFLCHSLGLLIHEHSKTHNIVTFSSPDISSCITLWLHAFKVVYFIHEWCIVYYKILFLVPVDHHVKECAMFLEVCCANILLWFTAFSWNGLL